MMMMMMMILLIIMFYKSVENSVAKPVVEKAKKKNKIKTQQLHYTTKKGRMNKNKKPQHKFTLEHSLLE
jgi:sortase (surface protein transpeptidase)